MKTTKIQWANHTGGPWLICSMVSAGCTNCYAMALMLTRLGPLVRRAYKLAGFVDWETRPIWGDKATRVLSKGFWREARRINAQHAKAGTRGRWFPSMIDWLDIMPAGIIDQDGNHLEPIQVLADFLTLIHDTPNLDWLLLTKRPENWKAQLDEILFRVAPDLPDDLANMVASWIDGHPPKNIWLGTSVEDQKRADERIPALLEIPAHIRFLSAEPLLSDIKFRAWKCVCGFECSESELPKPLQCPKCRLSAGLLWHSMLKGIHWAIVGGESGRDARGCDLEWIRSIVRQCATAGVPPFVKQLGSNPFSTAGTNSDPLCHPLRDPKGGDPAEWPEDLRVRQFPTLS